MFGGFGDNPFGVNFNFGGDFPQRFDENYRVYPVSFCDKGHLEDGDKILLPPSALETLARLHIEYPMLFKVINEGANRHSHCGVLEFSAPEGTCYMPYWMMQNLFINEGGILNIQNVSLPKATFVKIRPQSQDFLDISNPRAVLEASLRKFSCMTIGDTICLKYNNKNFMLDVREVRPGPAACIIETDCEVDFEPPADYVPPVPQQSSSAAPPAAPSSLPYGGVPTMSAKDVAAAARPARSGLGGGGLRLKKGNDRNATDATALRAARLRKFEVFHGTGQSLSGIASTYTAPTTTAAATSASSTDSAAASTTSASSSAPASTDADKKPEAEAEAKRVPFQGPGRRLRELTVGVVALSSAAPGRVRAHSEASSSGRSDCRSTASTSPPPPMLNRVLSKLLRETYGHELSVYALAVAAAALLLSSALYFLSPLLEDDYHIYQQYLPWVYYLDWGQYDSFIVDHAVVFLAISLPMMWLFLMNVAYSSVQSRLDVALLLLRMTCCLTVCCSLTVILTDFLSRRVMIAIISLAYGVLGLVYSWTVPAWRWYMREARVNGLVTFMPEAVQHMLLRITVLEWLTDTSFMDQIKQFLPFLLPLTKSEQNRLLDQLPAETQILMTRPGMIGFLPESMQRVLLPADECLSDAHDLPALENCDHTDQDDASSIAITELQLPPSASAGFEFHSPEVESKSLVYQQQAVSTQQEIITDIVSKRFWKTCSDMMSLPSSETLDRTAAISSALLVLQVYSSRRSRRTVLTVIQFMLASSLASVAGLALFVRLLQLTDVRQQSMQLMYKLVQHFVRQNSLRSTKQIADSANSAGPFTARKAATSATLVFAAVYALRKLRR
ncbi:TPA: hypothetical protein N0F65_012529 [Lagenidium giganteum]|uniref:Ubiquitin fusion degradation protein n=1 Tax=Lagenidium giganteum TaxID=4803 RepID=A0AAV2YLM0_9STRA|nr:TPA: hypothetical protein N0F65_012529 [Lagenidium giganteum]